MTISVSPEDLDALQRRLDQWAETLKSTVSESARAEQQAVEGLPQFQGQSADAYRQQFEQLASELIRNIEEVSDNAIRQMAQRAGQIGQAFQDMDSSFGF
jgi:uncharacterized protein YukE